MGYIAFHNVYRWYGDNYFSDVGCFLFSPGVLRVVPPDPRIYTIHLGLIREELSEFKKTIDKILWQVY